MRGGERETPSPREGRVDRALRLGFAALGLAAALLGLAEGAARIFFTAPSPLYVHHPLLGPTLAPGTSFERLSIDEPPVLFRVEINALGFRGKRMKTEAKPAGTYRIFFLGASTVENALLPEERTFPGRTDDALNEHYKGAPPVEVANCGVAGTGIEYAEGMLLHRVLPLEPDLCVFLVGHNAWFATINSDWDPAAPPLPEIPPTFKDWLTGASRLVAVLDARKRARSAREDNKRDWYESHRKDRRAVPFTPPRVDVLRGLPYFRTQLHRIALLCKDAGVACAFMTQPNLYKDSMKPEEEATLVGARLPDGQNLETPVLKKGLDGFNEAIREACSKEGVILIDAAREVPQDLEHFIDDVHLTSAGNEAVARSVLQAIQKDGKLPRP
jgi:lysophospholipase L1-like esterase